ncbi:MAG: 3-oxoacyl-ACP synthase III [bacterium]|nr:3-oxoacyl-ACP synthase III [bacterium]
MRFQHVCIESFGYELPEDVVTSDELEQRLSPLYDKLKLPYGRLELMTGIRERRFWKKGALPSEGSIKAGKKALERASLAPEQIQCLIYAAVSRDFLEPATATVVHHALGFGESAMVFDLSNACLGFINGLVVIASMIESGQILAGMVVAGEHSRPLVETTIARLLADPAPSREKLKGAFASLTIGSGAAAAILTHARISKTGHRLLGGIARTVSQHNDLCRGGGAGGADSALDATSQPTMKTDSERLLREGCYLARRSWVDTKRELGWKSEDIDRFFCHQVGSAHRRALFTALELDMEKDYSTFEYLGNMGSVSLPITMAIGIDQGMLKAGQRAALLGIGSGITCCMLGVEW